MLSCNWDRQRAEQVMKLGKTMVPVMTVRENKQAELKRWAKAEKKQAWQVRGNWRRVWLLGLMVKKVPQTPGGDDVWERSTENVTVSNSGLKHRGAWLLRWSAEKGRLGGTKMQNKVSWQKHTNVATRDAALPKKHFDTSAEILFFLSYCCCSF